MKRLKNVEKIEIFIPKTICINNKKFYVFISTLYHDLKKYKNTKIRLNCKKLKWIDPSVCAALALIFDNFKRKNNLEFVFISLSERHKKLFSNNNFYKIIDKKNSLNYKNPSIKLSNISTKSLDFMRNYLDKNLKNHNFYSENNSTWRNIIRCVLEIYKNAYMHGQSLRLFICGHFFPETQSLIFSLANLGETFKSNYLKKRNYNFENDLSAILYSLDLFSSSRNNSETGGLGLYYLRKEFEKLGGEFIIYSGNGLYIEGVENKKKFSLDKIFPGTVVSIKIKLNNILLDKNKNSLISEINLKELINMGGEIG